MAGKIDHAKYLFSESHDKAHYDFLGGLGGKIDHYIHCTAVDDDGFRIQVKCELLS